MSVKKKVPARITRTFFSNLRREAKKVKRDQRIPLNKAQNQVAESYGFQTWSELADLERRHYDESVQYSFPGIPEEIEEEDLLPERDQDLPVKEKVIVAENRKKLARLGIDYALFEPTATGLKKSILDATAPVRHLFEQSGLHFYGHQDLGPVYKKFKRAFFVSGSEIEQTWVSLYRPKTKKGDPRMWFRGLGKFANAGEQIAIIVHRDRPHLVVLSRAPLPDLDDTSSTIAKFLNECVQDENTIADELLAKLKELAKKPIPADKTGSTAIGMAVEQALGIEANSSKTPDYKGIELKSGRTGKDGKSATRSTLFAQVADWNLSHLKSSAQILDTYGYMRDEVKKLYCQVEAGKANSQGLRFKYDDNSDLLHEVDGSNNRVATWPGNLLRGRLREKHAETFWIAAESLIDPETGRESFQLLSVVHTKSPLENQLMPLIENGVISMDHLISRKKGRVSEKGPLFKIAKQNLPLLFPEPKKYSLTTE